MPSKKPNRAERQLLRQIEGAAAEVGAAQAELESLVAKAKAEGITGELIRRAARLGSRQTVYNMKKRASGS